MTQFSSLGLAEPILRALGDAGYTTPTPIQAQSIEPAMSGRDLLGCAQTGTGKTAAFALPILHRLHTAGRGRGLPRALVLSPTRELASQIAESFAEYGSHTRLRGTVIYGGVSQYRQEKALRAGVDVVIATPGRLIDLMEQGLTDFSAIETLVLDEADRMLDMGFIHPIRRIAAAIPASRQTLMFSATMPREITKLADSLLRDPVRVSVDRVASAAPLIEQVVYMAPRSRKQGLLEHLLLEHRVERGLVFTKTKHGADRVCRNLRRAGVTADSIHGNKSQNQRQRALDGFRSGRASVLVATDVAARGLDVDGITHVFNFDLPMEPEAYVHRIGRTGRAGAKGMAIAFCDHEERGLLKSIERLIGTRVEAVTTLPEYLEAAAPVESDGDSRSESRGGRGPKRAGRAPGRNGRRSQAGGPKRGKKRGRRGPTAGGEMKPPKARRGGQGRPGRRRPGASASGAASTG
ncbi:MAG: DEAD/DEAH box helicase [Planctomycetota bacterium]|nr:DEAD/DEAH box helicase [Planctomycetota bacterium]